VTQITDIEKHIYILDNLYRCFILPHLNSAFRKITERGRRQNHTQHATRSTPLLSGRDCIQLSLPQKEMVEELKTQWKKLWQERLDDKVRAEGVATDEYANLFVEKGTIIHATRDYKALNFKEILVQNQIANTDRFIPPPAQVGGWTKFVKTSITSMRPQRHKRALLYREAEKKRQQPKKGGRGWLHI